MAVLRARLIGPEERQRFDAFVAGHPAGSVLQSWSWGEIRGRQRWRPLRLVVEQVGAAEPAGIRAAAGVLARDLPTGGSVLYLPRGPVVDFLDAPVLDALLAELRRVGRRERAILVKIDPYVAPPDARVRRALALHGLRVGHRRGRFDGLQPRFCCILSLMGGEADLLAGFHAKTRYNIRLAERRGVVVERRDKQGLAGFHRLLMETCERDGFRERDYGYFEQVWDGLEPGGHIHLFVASHAGRDLAAAVVTTYGDKAVYAYGASSNEQRHLMAPYAVQWAAIRFALERGCASYDMTGVPKRLRPGEPGYGLWRFKRGFCGETPTEFLGEYDLPLRPLLWHAWNAAEPAYWRTRVALEGLARRLRPA